MPKTIWTKEQTAKIRKVIAESKTRVSAVNKLQKMFPRIDRRVIYEKVYSMWINEENAPKKKSVDWGDELKKSCDNVASKYKAKYVNGILMRDGKRISWGELIS